MVGAQHELEHRNYITKMLRDMAKREGYDFESDPHDTCKRSDWCDVTCGLETPRFRATFHVQQMPGCCAVLVLSYIRTQPYTYNNIDEVIRFVEEGAKNAAFGSVAMTQVVPHFSRMFWKKEPWILCLAPNRKWAASPAFRNGKSGNLVTLLTKDLEQDSKMEGFEEIVQA
jgi:hypothetical protein